MGGMAKLLKENEFPTQFHEGVKANIHIQLVGNRVILAVIFDSRATLGLVRLRVKRASDELNTSSRPSPARRPHPRRRAPSVRSPTRTSTTSSTTDAVRDRCPFHQLPVARDQLQDRLLRPRPVREDHEPPVDLPAHGPEAKGKMISLATEQDRTLFFDFLPLSLGEIRGFKTRFHLYTVPGQVFYDASRKLILKGVDGVVFVADSQIERMEANLESLENLQLNLAEQGYRSRRSRTSSSTTSATCPTSRRRRAARAAQPDNVPDYEAVAQQGHRRLRHAQGRRQARADGAEKGLRRLSPLPRSGSGG
jgi:hypothetical protein